MKQIYSNIKKGVIKLKPENLDDMWYLSNIIDPGDLIKGKTIRKIKLGEKEQRKIKIIKKPVFIEIKAEKIEFSKYSSILRVGGLIVECPDEIQKGSYHTFNIEENTIITITKEKWLKFQLEKLKEALIEKGPKILICILDREEALFALTKKQGYELLSKLEGKVQKKGVEEKKETNFYFEIIKTLQMYNKRYKIDNIIIASPAFWKEELLKNLKDDELKSKITLATCSSVSRNAVNEVLKRNEVKEILKKDRIAKEINLVEDLLVEIAKNNLAVYGSKETENAANAGAVKLLLITDSFIRKTREENIYEKIEQIMKIVESTKGNIHIISSEHEGGKKLDGLGGIGALLRYKLNY